MKRLIIISTLMLSLFWSASARDGNVSRFTFGAEWAYVATFFSGYHYNFFAPEGYRVDPLGYTIRYGSNAEAYIHAGYDINSEWNISIYAGLTGIDDYHMAVPLSIRGTRFFGEDSMCDRWFAFMDIGSGISIKHDPQEILTWKIGGGYRLSLSRRVKMDFLVSARLTYTHPEIVYYGNIIPMERINRNNAYVSAVSFGMALTF